MKTEDAREIIDAFAEENPEVYRLALAASLAVRVEPELVRALRLCLFPEADAGAEADLWFSPLVQSQTPIALEFEPEVLGLLHYDLAKEQELLRRVWGVLEEFHGSAPYALRLEEELTWLGLSSGERSESLIEKHLHSVLAQIKAGQRLGLARWASRALPSLPEKARETEAARRLSIVAGVQTGVGPVLTAMPGEGVTQEWLSEVTAKKILRVKVGVRLLKNETPEPAAPVAATNELPMLVEFSYPPAPAAEVIEVPDTYRLLLEVSWPEGEARRLRQLSLLPNETRRVEAGYGEVGIRTALGDMFTLRPRFDYEFMLLYDISFEPWARNLVERLERQDWRGKRLRVTASPYDEKAWRGPDEEEELRTTFGLSRKVGFAVSDPLVLTQLEPSRPEPRDMRDWLIPIKVGSSEPYFGGGSSSPVIDFSREGQYEEGYRALWKTITGEDIPPPEPPTKSEAARNEEPVRIFISYSHRDKKLRDELVAHLASLESEGLIARGSEPTFEDDRRVKAGQEEWTLEIDRTLKSAQIILLLVSADYLASEYCYDIELARAMERHESGDASAIPVILSPCDWKDTSLRSLQALPKDAKPVTTWRRRSEAFANIAEGIRRVAEHYQRARETVSLSTTIPRPPAVGFIARRDEQGHDILERLKEELAPGRIQLVTLSGPGGVGKTTLAAEAARGLRAAYDNRIIWSSVEGRADFTLLTLLDDIATQLGRAELRAFVPNAKEEQVRALVAETPALVVLDNYETVAPDVQQRIEEWLKRAHCSALITSRHRVAATINILIAVMSREETHEFLERLITQTRDPQIFSGDVRRQIYEAAEANPFVMQLVVAGIDEAREPSAVLEELKRGEGAAAERVFNRSLNLPRVGDDGRAALLALSLFAPSASRPALAEVAGFGDDLKRLEQAVGNLHALWLIKGLDENSRFTIEGLTRSLAATHLSKDSRASEFRQRFVAYFLRYAEAHAQPTPEDYDMLEAEKDNLLSAADVAFAAEDWGSVMRMAYALAKPIDGVLSVRGYWNEALRLGDLALKAARSSQAKEEVAVLSHNVAVMYQMRGQVDEARRLYEMSLEINKKLGDQSGIASTLHQLGWLAQDQGELAEARRLYDESLKIEKKLGNQSGIATTLHELGRLAQEQGELDEARWLYGESLDIKKKLGNQRGIATTLHYLAMLAQNQSELDEARRLYGESLEIAKKLGDQNSIARTLHQLAMLAQDQGEVDEARRFYTESLVINTQLGNQSGIATTLHQLGRLAEDEGNKAEAARLFREALIIFEKLGSPYAEVTRKSLAHVEGESSSQRLL